MSDGARTAEARSTSSCHVFRLLRPRSAVSSSSERIFFDLGLECLQTSTQLIQVDLTIEAGLTFFQTQSACLQSLQQQLPLGVGGESVPVLTALSFQKAELLVGEAPSPAIDPNFSPGCNRQTSGHGLPPSRKGSFLGWLQPLPKNPAVGLDPTVGTSGRSLACYSSRDV
jgi:hypothetical protein